MKSKPTEFAINSFASMMTVLQPDDFNHIPPGTFSDQRPCHVYLIGSRPRIGVVKESLRANDRDISLAFKIWQQDTFTEVTLTLPNEFHEKGPYSIVSKYPFTTFTLKSGTSGLTTKSALILTNVRPKNIDPKLIDLQVLYIGQSYGADGSRMAPERLAKHETLQAVYGEASRDYPDREIWVMLFSFEQLGIVQFDGVSGFSTKEFESDKGRAEKFLHTIWDGGITERQFINFTEAAMIRYFQPKYNNNFKYNFPNPAHSSYSECYGLDVNSVNVELGTFSAVRERLYSDTIVSKNTHFGTFALHNSNDRKGMFDYFADP